MLHRSDYSAGEGVLIDVWGVEPFGISPLARFAEVAIGNDPATIGAAVAKNEFGQIVGGAVRGRSVTIQRCKETMTPISKADYDSRLEQREASLASIRAECDEMIARMQRPAQAHAIRKLFKMTPEELGRTAIRMSRQGSR